MEKESKPYGERIVISGIAGTYPQARSVKELSDILYNKVNPIKKTDRWQYDHLEFSRYLGEVSDTNLFDSQFFKVNYHVSQVMDPMSRMLLEQTYRAIYDAGLWPEHFSGKKIGVFAGSSASENEKTNLYSKSSKSNPRLLGTSKNFFANRISYWLNSLGPSETIDNDSCSSITALELAHHAIYHGDCEAAIVTGSYLCLHPQTLVHYGRIVPLSPDGKTKSFDENADGNVLSEAVNVLILQKEKDALRIYAEVVNVKTEYNSIINCKSGPRYGFNRDPRVMAEFFKQFYNDSKVSPLEIEYVEAVGSGVPEADKAELESIDAVYCEGRRDELLVGSVGSSIGNTVAASGISAITKVLLGYQTGLLAGTLHCERPRQDISGIAEGRIRILTNNNNFRRTYAAVNNMSITGVNGIVLLRGYYKKKDKKRYESTIPWLVIISSRQDSSVTKIFNDLKSRPIDPEEIALLHNIHENIISGHMGRGFLVIDEDNSHKTISLHEQADYYDEIMHPLWFVYSGMGSQWVGMGTQLMRIPIFAASIERCQRVLSPKGLDIVHIITSTDKTTFDNTLNSFVGIAAIQIGLTDVLKEIGLYPDKIIGHSVGELGCAYADGCLTAEEMILSAYYRGIVSGQTPLIRGSMAAVGLGYQSISKLCPSEIDIACHNGPESSTISGPVDVVREFVDNLTTKGIFAKIVPSSNIAYHSRYIQAAGPMLLNHLKKVIKTPKRRSERWLSTSVPQEQWTKSEAMYSSAEYHTNNLLNPVLFEETLRNVPSNAVVVEIAPHGLLQAILKRSLANSCHNVPLTRKEHGDNAFFLLNSIGRLYMLGYNPKISKLYPKVEYPVSTGTPSLSHLVEMAHVEKWSTTCSLILNRTNSACYEFIVSVEDRANSYLKGHIIKDQFLYPFAGVLVAVWDTLAMSTGDVKRRCSVRFQDVHLLSQPILCEQRPLKLSVTLQKGSGKFEVMNEKSTVLTGKIIKDLTKYGMISNKQDFADKCNYNILKSRDVYHLLNERGYNYSGDFRSIHSTGVPIEKAHLLWRDNWVTLIDGMLQLNVLKHTTDGVAQPIYIRNIFIDPTTHIAFVENIMEATIDETLQLTSCGGISIQAIKFRELPPIHEDLLDLKITNPVRDNEKMNEIDTNYNMVLYLAKSGNFDSLEWLKILKPDESGVEVSVHYAGLSQNDRKRYITKEHLICAKNNFNNINTYGVDFSGITQSGERLMGIVYEGTSCSHIMARPELLWSVPTHWSMEDAATVPLAYVQAFYCLVIKAKVCPSMSILVHDGTSAFGQAVISIALAIGCQVFTTIDNIYKKRFLLKMFPTLKECHIGNSRDHTFKDMVMNSTNGKGCDIVIICSVEKELKNASLSCCGLFGITLDIDIIDRQESYLFGMNHLNLDRNYFRIDFNTLLMKYDLKEMEELQRLVSEGISRGYVRPLSRSTFTASDAPRAFHLLADSRHHGKVLLQLSNDQLPVQPKFVFIPYHNHVVFCNQQALGIQLADALVKRGARNLFIHYENPPAYLQYKIRSWEAIDVQVTILSAELVNSNAVGKLLNDVSGIIEGVYYISTKYQYNNKEQIQSLLLNLDVVTRELCPFLKYFGVITNEDNNYEQKICLNRAKERLPATFLSFQRNFQRNISSDENYLKMDMKYCRAIINAMERALTSPYSMFTVELKPIKNCSILNQIAAIAAINVPEDIQEVTTLGDLGVGNTESKTISEFVRYHYSQFIKENEIPSLTIQQIYDIEDTYKKRSLKVKNLLDQFYSYVDTDDEMKMAVDVVPLPTLFDKANTMYEEFDVSETYLYIVPGLEGHPDPFRTICEGLKLPALVLIPGTDEPEETIEAMAQRLTKVVLQKIGIKDTFYLLGYENGMFVALEMAAILEKHGISGTVFLLGCIPGEFKKILNNFLNGLGSEEQLQNAILLHIFKLIIEDDATDFEKALRETTLWTEKLELYARTLTGRTRHSIQYTRSFVETALGRIKVVGKYISHLPKLKSKLVLMQSSDIETSSLSELQNISLRSVDVHRLGSPLALAAREINCSTIINEYLSSDILEKFNKKNLCETYLVENNNFFKL